MVQKVEGDYLNHILHALDDVLDEDTNDLIIKLAHVSNRDKSAFICVNQKFQKE